MSWFLAFKYLRFKKFRYISELAVIILCIVQLFIIALEIYGQGIRFYLTNLVKKPLKKKLFIIIFIKSNVLFLS
jgi:hypothetical protein